MVTPRRVTAFSLFRGLNLGSPVGLRLGAGEFGEAPEEAFRGPHSADEQPGSSQGGSAEQTRVGQANRFLDACLRSDMPERQSSVLHASVKVDHDSEGDFWKDTLRRP